MRFWYGNGTDGVGMVPVSEWYGIGKGEVRY